MRKQRFLVTLIILIGLISTQNATAQSGPTLDVRAGFDGYYKPNGWVPVTAVVANQGADIDGEIRIPAQESWHGVSYTQPALLPTGPGHDTTAQACSRGQVWWDGPYRIPAHGLPMRAYRADQPHHSGLAHDIGPPN